MSDVHTPEIRSFNMSMIKSKNTKPEIIVRKFLHSNGLRYRLHQTDLPGKPDIVLRKYMTVIFINGCFWHGHSNCKDFIIPKTRTIWWKNKISQTKSLDRINNQKLELKGWKVISIFECELKKAFRQKTFNKIIKLLEGNC